MSRARQVAETATLDIGFHNGWGGSMNNPEVTMHDKQQSTRFDALEKATNAAGIAISLAMRVPAPLKPIGDQIIRSASSVPANIAEGAGRTGRDRMYHYRIAYGSAKEVDTHLQLLLGAGVVNTSSSETALRLFDDVRAMIWRLLHPER